MPLFDVPIRAGRSQDIAVIKKTKTKRQASAGVKKGNGVLGRIAEIKAIVETNLGQYRDEYEVIQDKDQLHEYITECIGNGYISIDTETNGLDPLQNILAGICPYTYGQKGAYIPINHISYVTGMKVDNQLDIDFVMSEFKRLLEKKPDIDMFNAKFDIRFLRANGLENIYCTWDGYLASRVLNENEPHKNLKDLHNKYCLNGKGDAFRFDDLFKGIEFTRVPIQTGYLYAAHDPVITSELCDYQRKYLTDKTDRQDIKDMYWLFKNIEMPCVSVVCDMEDAGIKLDLDYAHELSQEYNKRLEEKIQRFYDICDMHKDEIDAYRKGVSYSVTLPDGTTLKSKLSAIDKKYGHIKKINNASRLSDPINIGSPTQIAILLYDILKIEHPDGVGSRSTGEPVLQRIEHPIAKAILEYREIAKLLSTYIDKLPECVNKKDGRIHCSFNQYGADTGRFSSSDPNLQNIPSHNKDIRKMFVASPGYVLMSSDYSQQEPKVMTQMCQDKEMINSYRAGKDLYSQIASISFNTTYDECLEFFPKDTPIKKICNKWYYANSNDYDKLADGEKDVYTDGKERRSQAKSILLGVLYGRGVPSIAEQLGTSTKKAQTIKDSVFKGFPAIPKFEKDSLKMGEELGYVTTLWGRKRRLPDLQLPEYEFTWKDGAPPDDDPLSFDGELQWDEVSGLPVPVNDEVPEDIQEYYLKKLHKAYFGQKRKIFEEANEEGIWIVDNGGKIADAQRQCVNARIQGSAADMSKLAMILVGNDKRLKELGFRLLIPVHDELIAECPEENMKECSERFAVLMSKAAESKLDIPIKCDVEITREWYGEPIRGEKKVKETSTARELENELLGKGKGNWVTTTQVNRKNSKRRNINES